MNTIENQLSVFALGGIREIGKNMYVIQYADDIFVIDCGGKFPDESEPGVDLLIQDISYLQQHQEKIRALIVTHGHEDHIGGIPYFLKQLNVPVYATRFTLGLITLKLKEHRLFRQTELNLIHEDSTLSVGAVQVTFFKTNHSIPDCLGIIFDTPEGTVVHTGDFKFDFSPVHDEYADLHKMAEIGKNGVLLLLSESTNAERPGFNSSERLIGKHLEEAFQKASRKVFVSTFASNVHRLQQVVDAAQKTGRKLALLGRSMVNVVEVASEIGYLQMPPDMLIDKTDIDQMDPEKVAVLCTGSQGEPMAALSRLANGSFRQAEILPEDTVIFASSPIPGNEKSVSRIIDRLFLLGADVIYGSGKETGMHVSGHAYQEELKLMLSLMKPKYFIPIHGEYRMLEKHRQLAESVGVEKDHIFVLDNGDVVDIQRGKATQTRTLQAGTVFVDGSGIGDVGNTVLRDRKQLSEEGMLVIVMTLEKSNGQIIGHPKTVSRGFVYIRDSKELLDEVDELIRQTIGHLNSAEGVSKKRLKQEVRKAVENFLFERTKRKPVILPIVIEV